MKRYMLYLMIMVLLAVPSVVFGQDGPENTGTAVTDDTADDTAGDDGGMADEVESEEFAEEAWEEMAELPPMHYVLEPDFRAWAGFRVVDVQGSRRALEYGWPYSSPTGGLLLHYAPLPHRIDFELDMLNHKDYNAEASYAWRDILKLDYRGWSLYHNLDHANSQPFSDFVDFNPAAAYHVTARDNRVFLRLKWPDRAYHAFVDFRQFEKEGLVQQMYDRGFPAPARVSKSRILDWATRNYTMGVNGHFGPVELEYAHRTKTFNPSDDARLVDTIGGVPGVVHSYTPDLQTDSDTVKLHTDLTGRVVGSVTLVNGDKKNNRSSSVVDFRRAFADLVLIPVEHVTVALRYRYKELQENVRDSVGARPNGVPGATKDPMDSRTNQASVTVRYAPVNEFGMKLEYVFENTNKQTAKAWSESLGPGGSMLFPFQDIPQDQNLHTVKLGADLRPFRSLSAKGSVEYSYTDDPAYPIRARNGFKGRFDVDWMPHGSVNMDTYYRFAREENSTANMNLEKDNIGTLVTWAPIEKFACYLNYDYTRFRNERDLSLVSGTDAATFAVLQAEKVPYTDASHFYAAGAGYTFAFPLYMNAEFHQSWSWGKYRTKTASGLGERNDLKVRETGGTFMAGYDFTRGWGTSVEYDVNDFQDLVDKPQNGPQDGVAHAVMLLVKKKW